jgi:hypothetical protein
LTHQQPDSKAVGWDIRNEVSAATPPQSPANNRIINYNNDPGRKKEDILELLKNVRDQIRSELADKN